MPAIGRLWPSIYNADVDDGGGNGDGREVVDNADSDKVDYDDGGHGLYDYDAVDDFKAMFFVKGTEVLVRRRGRGWSMTRTGR